MSLIPISDIVERVRSLSIRRIALQAPEGLKRELPVLAEVLREEGFSVIISGDPCYGACDLALDTLDYADILIHFGHTPLMDHPRVLVEPILQPEQIPLLDSVLPLLTGKKIGLISTAQHANSLPLLAEELIKHGFSPVIAPASPRTPLPGQVLGCTYTAARETQADCLLYLGTGVFHAIGSGIATRLPVISLDPYTGEAGVVETDRPLRRRFAVIEKARSADRFGIIVSQKCGQNRMKLAEELLPIHPNAEIVLLREVTADQLLNLGFPCYVNCACPRLGLDDQIRFPVPVLSPPEFEILCGRREWDDYEIDEIRS
ncbi:diphthamide biosynthesis enzyme Dph2 [Methanocalculus taiwanensis]|uniref:2-(3-amino-3-carboxypropyl)histidine synthase n=1 Tax=Methanocalculus taiwanensis TaxID=106207 RepID=A0ABD4TIP2_9EURY|nr:diphthamide biosynthesis enzyme Dph2 [Methanocalculus taiwanensis]MCQ1538611.1 diphthamide biosynthesis enzyme Dph2 [Methanocalculus taiwanensis]